VARRKLFFIFCKQSDYCAIFLVVAHFAVFLSFMVETVDFCCFCTKHPTKKLVGYFNFANNFTVLPLKTLPTLGIIFLDVLFIMEADHEGKT
jgi:hypothetical protein